MEITREGRRTRWLILMATWLVVLGVALLHTRMMHGYLDVLDGMGRRNRALTTPLQRPLPTLYADALTWTRHTLTLVENDQTRIRRTDIDNAPFGREVHWCSGFAWVLAGGGWVRHLVTGEPLAPAIEGAREWLNLILFAAFLIALSLHVARRAGVALAVVLAAAMFGNTDFYSTFAPAFFDHHGILSTANLGAVLGAVFMGAGWWKTPGGAGASLLPSDEAQARRGAIFSAVCAAIGIWVSAASVLPAVPFIGVAGILATWLHGRTLRKDGAEFSPGVWRLWGRLGGALCLGFYLLEYFPHHLGWRLEGNHPLYALAWWAGAEIVARIGEHRIGRAQPRPLWLRLAPWLAVFAPVVVIKLGGPRVFLVSDPFLRSISAYVSEGLDLVTAVKVLGPVILTRALPWIAITFLPGVALWWLCSRKDACSLLTFALLATAPFLALGFYQVRFIANGAGPEIALLLVVVAVALTQWPRRAVQLALVGAVIVFCAYPWVERLQLANAAVRTRRVTRSDALQPLYRDIAAALRASQPSGPITLLTNPDASTGIGYFGRFRTIGTLYWENVEGMRASAAMHAARSMEEARTRLRDRGVTHVAVISENSFVREFYQMTHGVVKGEEWRACFAGAVFEAKNLPLWLEPIAYEPPPDSAIPGLRVVLCKTRFSRPEAEEIFPAAITALEKNDLARAEALIDRALAVDDAAAEFWLFKGELFLRRGDVPGVIDAVDKALMRAPHPRRAELARTIGNAFLQRGQAAGALRFYRISLALQYDANTAANTAWLLATSADASLRDGKIALELAERMVREEPRSHVSLSALAAALAENGRFEEAARFAAQALDLARTSGNETAARNAGVWLQAYRAGRPWRQ